LSILCLAGPCRCVSLTSNVRPQVRPCHTTSILGIEYLLRSETFDQAMVRDSLARLSGGSISPNDAMRVEYTYSASPAGEMPDATVVVGASSVYFCDHGGQGRAVMGAVVAQLCSVLGAVTIEEL